MSDVSSRLRVGVDIIEISRIGATVERFGKRFLERVYTPQELAFSRGRLPQLAGRFAAKEAVMKALGTGLRGVSWREVEVVRQPGRAPQVRLHGRAGAVASKLGLGPLTLSTSHSRDYAIAMVVGEVHEDHNQ